MVLRCEMYYHQRSARISKLDRVHNDEIRNRTKVKQTVVERVERKELKWFRHLLGMDDQSVLKEIILVGTPM